MVATDYPYLEPDPNYNMARHVHDDLDADSSILPV